jgi:N-acetylglucosamine kinase-like BadF-type ATPase
MILIADSGSTKTDWRLIDDNKQIHQYATQGISPYFQTSEEIAAMLKSELLSQITIPLTKLEINYFGTGCANDEKKSVVVEALNNNFKDAVVNVDSDMLGAARALCGKEVGIASILGTGSNTCYYNGTSIYSATPSLGYLLGDEGSGAHIGKTFIQAFLNNELPENIKNNFLSRNNITQAIILDNVYKKPYPNRYLASFSKFVFQNIKEQYLTDMVVNCFQDFFDKHICKYPNHKEIPLNCVGSVAFYYSKIIKHVAENNKVVIGSVIESPIAALSLYYLEE